MTGSLHDKLNGLKQVESDAKSEVADLEHQLRREDTLHNNLVVEWTRHESRRATADELLRRTADLIAQMQERGLALALMPGTRALLVVDAPTRSRHEQSRSHLNRARATRVAFERENAAALRAEADAQEAARIRATLQGDDPDAIRRVLAAGASR